LNCHLTHRNSRGDGGQSYRNLIKIWRLAYKRRINPPKRSELLQKVRAVPAARALSVLAQMVICAAGNFARLARHFGGDPAWRAPGLNMPGWVALLSCGHALANSVNLSRRGVTSFRR